MHDEMNVATANGSDTHISPVYHNDGPVSPSDASHELAYCYLRARRLQSGAFETLTRIPYFGGKWLS